jgi:tRNA-specific 2-thiouridylase
MDIKPKRVFVALSGGVDSAVAAAITLREGHAVTGVFIKIWHPEFGECPWREDRIAAKRNAAGLGIPFREIDLSGEYYETVIADMRSAYRAGRTPNPDVLCNRHIKFGSFLEWALTEGADSIVTGHHARVVERKNMFALARGVDPNKDQAYFLWQISQEQLSHVRMPVGGMKKQEVRACARSWSLPSADRPDSQGLCFVGDVDMHAFLKKLLQPEQGILLWALDGTAIGEHDGAVLYTLGQRHRFHVTDPKHASMPLYVVTTDVQKNTVTVAPDVSAVKRQNVPARDINWIREEPKEGVVYTAEVRYHQRPVSATVSNMDDKIIAHFDESVLAVPGQSLVLYEGDECLGGGIIT